MQALFKKSLHPLVWGILLLILMACAVSVYARVHVTTYYLNARYLRVIYIPGVGSVAHFITADTNTGQIPHLLSHNRYLYANDNPVNFIDATGHAPIKYKLCLHEDPTIGTKKIAYSTAISFPQQYQHIWVDWDDTLRFRHDPNNIERSSLKRLSNAYHDYDFSGLIRFFDPLKHSIATDYFHDELLTHLAEQQRTGSNISLITTGTHSYSKISDVFAAHDIKLDDFANRTNLAFYESKAHYIRQQTPDQHPALLIDNDWRNFPPAETHVDFFNPVTGEWFYHDKGVFSSN